VSRLSPGERRALDEARAHVLLACRHKREGTADAAREIDQWSEVIYDLTAKEVGYVREEALGHH
jgi:hypothetical protein